MCVLWSWPNCNGKDWHLLRYLQSNCTLLTILNYILYYTIPYYPMLCYSMLWHAILYCTVLYYTILYFTILNHTILCYTHTTLYYTHSIVIFTLWWGDSDCLTLKLPETGILVAQCWLIKNTVISFLYCNSLLVSSNKAVFWMFWKNGTLEVLTSDIQLVCFCASSQIDYRTEFVIKVWPYYKELVPRERPKWASSHKHHLNPMVKCTSGKAGLYTLKWCIWVDVASLWVGIIEPIYLWRMSLDKCLVFLIIIRSWT